MHSVLACVWRKQIPFFPIAWTNTSLFPFLRAQDTHLPGQICFNPPACPLSVICKDRLRLEQCCFCRSH